VLAALGAQVAAGDPAQFVDDHRGEPLQRLRLAVAPGLE